MPKGRHKRSPPPPPMSKRDSFMIIIVLHALHHCNAKHPGGEFDVVQPLNEASTRFRGQVWFHVNFWARSRSSYKIKRFFAEVHYKPPTATCSVCSDPKPIPVPEADQVHYKPRTSGSVWSEEPPFPVPVPVVEVCTIIEEPLGRYRRMHSAVATRISCTPWVAVVLFVEMTRTKWYKNSPSPALGMPSS
uniref:DUF3615 domain-containing protein n=1 Tax=Arundo donax TaxID=35708 RepID=A0A0A8ZMD4_ARUDO